MIEFHDEDSYEVKGIPKKILKVPDKEFEERYSVWRAITLGEKKSEFDGSLPIPF